MMKYTTARGKCSTHFSREEREEIAIGLVPHRYTG